MQGSNQTRILPEDMFIVIDVNRAMQLGYPLELVLSTAAQGILLQEDGLYQFVNKKQYIQDNSNLKGDTSHDA